MTEISDIIGSHPLPVGIDAKTDDEKGLYAAALEFERFFVDSMMKQMDSATKAMAGGDEESGDAAGATPQAYKDMIRDQMTQSVLDGGGLGLASMLYGQMREALGTSPDAPAEEGASK